MEEDLAYIVGLMIAEGCFDWGYPNTKSKGRATITIGDKEVGEWLMSQPYGMKWKTHDNLHYNLSSQNFISFLKWLGCGYWHAKEKRIPEKMYQCEKHVMAAMLQGMFDGDGYSDSNRKRLGYSSSSKLLCDEVRMILLNYGIMSSLYYHISPPTKLVKIECYSWTLDITADVLLFMKDIGFRITRKKKVYTEKRKKKSYLIPVDGFVWLPIRNISFGFSETVDYHIPEEHQFFSNGMISHNTPKGYNFYAMLRDSGIDVLTLHWKRHPLKDQAWYDYECSRRTPEQVAQELDISYNKSQEGRVYPEWNDDNVETGDFPYDPMLPLYVGWDFGASDDTAIIWVQKDDRGKLHVIDTYSNNGKTIDFYVPFITGILPSDGYKYTKKDLDCISFHKGWKKGTHFGDPAGRFHNQVTNTTVLSVLKDNGINVNFKDEWKEFQKRKTAVKLLIRDGIKLHNSNRNKYFELCITQSVYPSVKNGGLYEIHSQKPKHDAFSHFRSSFEYLALGLSDLQPLYKKAYDKFKPKQNVERKRLIGY